MAEDQSIIGKMQMYYDKNGGEMMICSDNEEEMVNPKDAKHDFTEAEDLILRMTLEECKSSEEALSIIQEFVKTTDSQIQSEKQQVWSEHEGDKQPCSDQCYLLDKGVMEGQKDIQLSNSTKVQADEMTNNSNWKQLEKNLYLKGVELFGKNSCLVARNLLPGFKTCLEVARYMFASGESMPYESIPSSITDINDKINAEYIDQEMPSRSRLLRKKCKTRKFSYSHKSIALSSRCRRIDHGKDQCDKQYTPCGCKGICIEGCPCLSTGTCEKYCGCSKLCNNRFKGCYCFKSQCRSQLCPCFAANRECDPDVCRNCWVSCGDGSLGEPPRHGDGQCANMNLLLGKKERILLSKSNVAGWGAFTKNPIIKNTCLGEYTGELITHREAEKRGKLYDRINNSYLFNVNDKWVIDARRFGNKLKFANHSSKPNCYAKVMLVGGDHRVGIFAKENIKAGDELFYHYYYNEECAPPWALPPKVEASKTHKYVSQGRAKKH
ncbi:histone-lysine N-methyltransferase EZ3-like [Glycine soja]|uniref:histone-lysine N-methyltransferase EZ3-like n=1 Tax=Glycine soja TaxID=3848 RepID=UPI0010398637|nr:histone-lysine N-methyltransferase EZ3-like [Glycine soja]